MNFYKRFIGDYQKKTGSLTILEHGAYTLMLDTFYATEAPLPLIRIELHRLLRAETSADRAAIAKVLTRFWTETPDGFVNERALEEIQAGSQKAQKSRENGNQGGRPRKPEDNPAGLFPETGQVPENNLPETSEVQKNNLSHSHSHKEPKTLLPEGFEDFWETFPKKVDKVDAVKAWKSVGHINGLLPTILSAVKTQTVENEWTREKGRYCPSPAKWIRGRRWEDEGVADTTSRTTPDWARQ